MIDIDVSIVRSEESRRIVNPGSRERKEDTFGSEFHSYQLDNINAARIYENPSELPIVIRFMRYFHTSAFLNFP